MSEQRSLAELFVDPRLGSNEKLSKIDALIDWSQVEGCLSSLSAARTGRPPYRALSMLKALYLRMLYDLSDPGLEAALLDRLSFRRFCGLGLEDGTPDETTLCRFRQTAGADGALERAFAEINRQLDARGLMLKKGTLMDASIITATHNPPPHSAGSGATHPREPGADWTRKGGESHFGYKLHVGVDAGSNLIRRVVVTPARVTDNEVARDLISGDERAVYADRLYESRALRGELKAQGIKDRIMHRRHRYLAELPHWKARRNGLIGRRRAPVESIFSALKRLYGRARARCHSLLTNTVDLLAFASVYNLRRASLIA